jgi:membrane-associated protease RseP (regulator of RpoE activity)
MQIVRFAGVLLVLAACGEQEQEEEVTIVPPFAHVTGFAPAFEPSAVWETKPREDIVRNSATDFDVKRTFVDRALEDQAEQMHSTTIVPDHANGHPPSLGLWIRPNSTLARLGFENGDRIETINGFDMTSPEQALEAYARLRSADRLTVALRRQGARMEIDYRIW